MTNIRNKRYILGVDPEQGIYLRGLGDLLNQKVWEICSIKRKKPREKIWEEGLITAGMTATALFLTIELSILLLMAPASIIKK